MKVMLINPGYDFSLRDLQDVSLDGIKKLMGIEDSYIEHLFLDAATHAYIDEEGKRQNLQVNEQATYICYEIGAIAKTDVIVGPMLVLGTLNEDGEPDGEEYPVPEEFISKWQSMLPNRN